MSRLVFHRMGSRTMRLQANSVVQLVLAVALAPCGALAFGRDLRVCADPNNLPFSNAAGEGFENRIVSLVARELGAEVRYFWWAQRRGFLRNTLNAGKCDVVAGVASELESVGTTRPYYRSSYAFVQPPRSVPLSSFDDPRLAQLKIGVQLIGDDGANTPPAHELARRGLTDNVRGYLVYGDYRDAAPQEAIVNAVARGEVDLAVVWGPVAGYFAALETPPLAVNPVAPDGGRSPWAMAFDISMATRKQDSPLRAELDRVLIDRKEEIEAILRQYRVPLVQDPGTTR